MNFRKNLKITITAVFAILLLAACGPKPEQDQGIEQPQSIPTGHSTENPFNPVNLGDCYNPFNPVMEGKVWNYTIQTGDTSNTFQTSYKDVTQSSFTSVQKFPEVTTEIGWSCNSEGLLSSQYANLSLPQMQDVDIKTVEVTGVVFPPVDKWQTGYSWVMAYKVMLSITIEENSFEGEGEISLTNTITSIEPVTVPAGSFPEAYRVDAVGEFKVSALGVETSIPTSYSSWYVRNVGMVKSGSDDPTAPYSMELVSSE